MQSTLEGEKEVEANRGRGNRYRKVSHGVKCKHLLDPFPLPQGMYK
jgi:hypothetical protein